VNRVIIIGLPAVDMDVGSPVMLMVMMIMMMMMMWVCSGDNAVGRTRFSFFSPC